MGVVIAGVLISAPAWGGDAAESFVIVLSYNVILAEMWNLLAGYAGLVTFGQQLFVGVGAYTLAIAAEKWGLDVWLAALLSVVVTGTVSIPVARLTFRLRGGYFAVGGWVLAECFRLLCGNWSWTGYASGMFVRSARIVSPLLVYYASVALAVGSVAFLFFLIRSPLGLSLLAIRDSEKAAASVGVDVGRAKERAFVIAAAGTGAAAALVYVQTPFVQPNEAFSVQWVASASFMVIIGGMGTLEGPIVGALLLVAMQRILSDRAVEGLLNDHGAAIPLVLGATSVGTMLLAPSGIIGTFGVRLLPTARFAASVSQGSEASS
jgi:branched-chain amino acid transport system permease protein